jgi:hypothetical protein
MQKPSANSSKNTQLSSVKVPRRMCKENTIWYSGRRIKNIWEFMRYAAPCIISSAFGCLFEVVLGRMS